MANQDKPKFYETQSFKALDAKWKAKLSKSGFEDAEESDRANLKNWSDQFSKPSANLYYNASKEEYYRLAGHFLYDHKFATEGERRVWELHQGGMSIRNIAKKVPRAIDTDLEPRNTTGGYATRVKKVQATIKRLATEMIDLCQKKRQ